ncbi:MAG: hypothetical protein ABH878_09855 [bacterium]
MKKFTFRLQRVKEIRELKEREEQRKLAHSLEELHREEETLHQKVNAADRSNTELRHMLGESFRAAQLLHLDVWRKQQQENLKAQTLRTIAQRKKTEDQRQSLILASQERKILDRLRERHLNEHKIEVQRISQQLLDESGARLHRKKTLRFEEEISASAGDIFPGESKESESNI